jgi:hypothetical protein
MLTQAMYMKTKNLIEEEETRYRVLEFLGFSLLFVSFSCVSLIKV